MDVHEDFVYENLSRWTRGAVGVRVWCGRTESGPKPYRDLINLYRVMDDDRPVSITKALTVNSRPDPRADDDNLDEGTADLIPACKEIITLLEKRGTKVNAIEVTVLDVTCLIYKDWP